MTKIAGDSKERDDVLTKDENNVPKILSVIYQELFPTFFLLSKSLNVSCPPLQIGGMGAATSSENNGIETIAPQQKITSEQETVPEVTAQEPIDEPQLETPDIVQPNV